MRTQIQIALIFLTALPATIMAQTVVDTTNYTIEDLYKYSLDELLTLKVSSATKFEEPIKDIPHSIEIITKEEIETFGYRTLAEALQHVIGFYMVDDYTFYQENFGIRGFFRDEWNQNIVFLVNGVRQRSMYDNNNKLSYINVPVQSIERIEVIKGAAAVTYGSGAFMGVVNIITNSDTDTSNCYINGGSQNTFNGGLNIHSKTEDLSFTINTGLNRTDGIDQNYRDISGDTNLMSGKFMNEEAAYFNISAQSKVFTAHLSIDKNISYRSVATPPYLSEENTDKATFQAIRYKLEANKDVTDWLILNSSYLYQFQEEELEFDFFGLPNNQETQNSSIHSHEYDLNMKIVFNENINTSFGYNLMYSNNFKDDIDVTTLGLSNVTKRLTEPMLIHAAYIRGAYNISPKFLLRAGLRFEKSEPYSVEYISNQGHDHIDPNHTVLDSTYILSYNYPDYKMDILPEISLIYQISKKHLIKLIYAEAQNKLSLFKIVPASRGVEPEHIQNIELNYNGALSDKLKTSTSIFYNLYTDLISNKFDIDDEESSWESSNTGKITTIGFELALDYRPVKNFSVYGAFNYNHTRDMENENVYPAFSPKMLALVNASYKIHSFSFGLTNQFVSATEPDYSYEPSDPNDVNSTPVGREGDASPAYLNMGLNIMYSPVFIKGFSANLKVSNLLDQKMYYPVTSTNSWATKGTLGISRTFLVGVNYKF